MKPWAELRTDRLLMRPWRDSDLDPLAALNADPKVMEHFPWTLTRAETASQLERMRWHWTRHGFGLWALEVPGEAPFIGFTGLMRPDFQARFTPCVEIGWRLAAPYWGRGYATEAARAALRAGFEPLGLEEILSFTTVGNQRSRRVMEKLGMGRSAEDDFDHPMLPEGHPLRRHVLYRLARPA